jgi:hypothetical protein
MNLTDLTTELETQAASAAPTPGMQRLVGVRHRIRVRRRRQVATAAGLTAFCVAAVVLFPGVSRLQAERNPAPPATVPGPVPGPGTRPSDPLTFVSDRAGDPLIAKGVSAPGSSELVVRFTPADTRLAISDFCRMPGVTAPVKGRAPFVFEMKINGHPFSGGDCDSDDAANSSTISYGDLESKQNRTSWAALGVVPGRESVIQMTAKPVKRASAVPPATRLGIGVYALSGERVVADGIPIKMQAEHEGHRYRLAGHTTAPATSKRRQLSLDVPAGPHPAMLLFGNPGDDSDNGRFASLFVDGEEVSANQGGGVASGELLDDAGAHRVELRLDSGLRGTMVIAYYVRVD